jgi:dienelactone hydrolase
MNKLASKLLAALLLAVSGASHAQASQQDIAFKPIGLQQSYIPGYNCSGFWQTPSFKCAPIQIPAYMGGAQDGSHKALVILSGNAGGLDKRHGDYARFLMEHNINAVVLDSFTARGQSSGTPADLSTGRTKGLDGFNMSIDAMVAAATLSAMPEWANAKIGYMGESMSGVSAINVLRPYIGQIVKQQTGKLRDFDAVVSIYPACIEKNTIERFKKIPFLIIHGEKDDIALAKECEKQATWMNARGGSAEITIIPDEYHDFDGPWRLRRAGAENTSKCANTRDGDKFVLDATGQEFPGTPEGYTAMRDSCKFRGHMSGHRDKERVGYDLWLAHFQKYLLND